MVRRVIHSTVNFVIAFVGALFWDLMAWYQLVRFHNGLLLTDPHLPGLNRKQQRRVLQVRLVWRSYTFYR